MRVHWCCASALPCGLTVFARAATHRAAHQDRLRERPVASRARKLPRIAVSLLGTGQVGSALLRQLAEQGGFAALRLVALANSRRALAALDGIAPADALRRLWDEG